MLIEKGGWIPAIRSAPPTVWIGIGLLVANQILGQILAINIVTLIVLPVSVLCLCTALGGVRYMWQLAIVFDLGFIVFALAPHNSIVGGIVGLASLAFLLAPPSRRYFRPGRIWVSRRAAEKWAQEGSR